MLNEAVIDNGTIINALNRMFAGKFNSDLREDFVGAQTLTDLNGHGLPVTWNLAEYNSQLLTRLNPSSFWLPRFAKLAAWPREDSVGRGRKVPAIRFCEV
jgi:hypothetical protein